MVLENFSTSTNARLTICITTEKPILSDKLFPLIQKHYVAHLYVTICVLNV
nr:MAG TPA: hypothetical protein [Caudoviricetes sp.]